MSPSLADIVEKVPSSAERNFSAPLVRPTLGEVRDRIDSRKSDQGLSYMSYRGFEGQRQLRTDIRENFGATQFSAFSTVSARNGHADCVAQCPLSGAVRKTFAHTELFRF
jgi:hypothetical protein